MAEPPPSELPIFELPLAIVPSEHVPLHIFEQRYRSMIASCLEGESPFGIVFRDDAGARAVGCTARVSEVVERYDDGRLDVIVRGGDLFRVLDRFEAPEWPAARVEMIDVGSEGTDDEPDEELAETRAAFAELLEAVGADPARASAAEDAFTIAAQIELPGAGKQRLLEAEDERERLLALSGSLREVVAGIGRSRRLAERAKLNGHGAPPGPP